MKRCPYCGKEILAVAKKCKYCGQWLVTETKSMSWLERNVGPVVVIILFIAVVIGAVAFFKGRNNSNDNASPLQYEQRDNDPIEEDVDTIIVPDDY